MCSPRFDVFFTKRTVALLAKDRELRMKTELSRTLLTSRGRQKDASDIVFEKALQTDGRTDPLKEMRQCTLK